MGSSSATLQFIEEYDVNHTSWIVEHGCSGGSGPVEKVDKHILMATSISCYGATEEKTVNLLKKSGEDIKRN